MKAGRYDLADARYDLALAATRQAGDKKLEGTLLQHQGGLAADRNQLDRANRLYQQALQHFREESNQGELMRTYNLLGTAEHKAGRLAEARAWYEKSREVAVQLKNQVGLAQAAQNIGIVCQGEGEAARKGGHEAAARQPLCGGQPAGPASPESQATRGRLMGPASYHLPSPRRPRKRRKPRSRSPADP